MEACNNFSCYTALISNLALNNPFSQSLLKKWLFFIFFFMCFFYSSKQGQWETWYLLKKIISSSVLNRNHLNKVRVRGPWDKGLAHKGGFCWLERFLIGSGGVLRVIKGFGTDERGVATLCSVPHLQYKHAIVQSIHILALPPFRSEPLYWLLIYFWSKF